MGINLGGALQGAATWAGDRLGDLAQDGAEAAEGLRDAVGDRLEDLDHAKNWVGGHIESAVDSAEGAIDRFRGGLVEFGEAHGGVAGKALAQNLSNGLGVAEGAGLALYDMGKGVVQLADGASKLVNPLEWATRPGDNLQRLEDTGKAALALGSLASPIGWALNRDGNVETAKALWNGVSGGYQEAARQGDWSKFVGRGVVDIGSLLIGAGEANAAAKGAGAVSRLGEGASALGKTADGVRAADAAADAAKIARQGDAAVDATKLVDAAKAGKATEGADDLAAILQRAETGRSIGGRKLLQFDSFDDLNTAANAALPNTVYEYGTLRWSTDAEGRIARAEGQVSLDAVGRNDASLQRRIGNEGYDTDVGFHLIADSFGGPTNRLNVVPGNGKPLADGTKNLNTGAYATFERQIRQIKQANPDLEIRMRVEAVYDAGNHSARPDAFVASYRAEGGRWIEYEFANIH